MHTPNNATVLLFFKTWCEVQNSLPNYLCEIVADKVKQLYAHTYMLTFEWINTRNYVVQRELILNQIQRSTCHKKTLISELFDINFSPDIPASHSEIRNKLL